jgi:hypothetical protein
LHAEKIVANIQTPGEVEDPRLIENLLEAVQLDLLFEEVGFAILHQVGYGYQFAHSAINPQMMIKNGSR